MPSAASAVVQLLAAAHPAVEPSVASHLAPCLAAVHPPAVPSVASLRVRLPAVPSAASLPVLLPAVPSVASLLVPCPVGVHLPAVPSVASLRVPYLAAVHLPAVPSAASPPVPFPAAVHPAVVPSEAWPRVVLPQEVQPGALLARVHRRRSGVGASRAVGRSVGRISAQHQVPAQPRVRAQVQGKEPPAVVQRVLAPPVAVRQEQVPREEDPRVRVLSGEVRPVQAPALVGERVRPIWMLQRQLLPPLPLPAPSFSQRPLPP